jgi:glutathione S-transferase
MHTLYYSPGACSLAVHIVLEEIGEPYATELVPVDVRSTAEAITAPAYLAINPKGRVPALTTGEGILTEAPAILTYLARRYPQARLLPADAEAEARVQEWMAWLASTLHAVAYGQVLRPQRFVADTALHPAVIAKGRRNASNGYAFVEARLHGREWAVADRYSIADAYLLFYYLSGKYLGFPMTERYPAWSKLADRTMERPAVQRMLLKERQALQAASRVTQPEATPAR